jgi:CDP-6-deoxy-D-xylo-4-hexulose-3-dehydrase
MTKLSLASDTIDQNDLKAVARWLLSSPRLTQGPLVSKLESAWSNWQGSKYSTFVNSGSSALHAAIYALQLLRLAKNEKIVFSSLCWPTSVSPMLQLGLKPIICDCELQTLGIDCDAIEHAFREHDPGMLLITHVLGIPNQMRKITQLCRRYKVLLIEDCCEATGSRCGLGKLGTLGAISAFSFYFGHHMSTIEGGMVCTNDPAIDRMLKIIRSHGWDRDLAPIVQAELRKSHNIDMFGALFTFYQPGMNIRASDLQAFIGLRQIRRVDRSVAIRNRNYADYLAELPPTAWRPRATRDSFVSSFGFPLLVADRPRVVEELMRNDIECRPLIAGSIGRQPFWTERFGPSPLPNADVVHTHGLYLPNHQRMTLHNIKHVGGILRSCGSAIHAPRKSNGSPNWH